MMTDCFEMPRLADHAHVVVPASPSPGIDAMRRPGARVLRVSRRPRAMATCTRPSGRHEAPRSL